MFPERETSCENHFGADENKYQTLLLPADMNSRPAGRIRFGLP
jgi:hypothetical protein